MEFLCKVLLTREGSSHRNEYGVSCNPDSHFLTGYDSDDASVRAAFSKEMFIDPK
jgi:flagellar hook protein FlgE